MSNPPHHNESSGDPEKLIQARDTRDINSLHVEHHETNVIQVPEAPAPPLQVPRPEGRFTNRNSEFEQLEDVVRTTVGGRRGAVVVLRGDEGVGKSVTLAEAAHRFRGSFPDGVLRRDLSQWRDKHGNLEHVAVQKSLLKDLHAEHVTGGTPADQLLTATTGLGLLLLLDGVASAAELEAFALGSGPHMAVATGLPRLARDGDLVDGDRELIDLGAFSTDDSMKLLRSFAQVERRLDDPDELRSARRLIEICGNLPAAVQMAARHMQTQDLGVTELVRALEPRLATVPPTAGVDAVIDLALSGLGENEHHVLELLSAYPARNVPGDLGTLELGEPAIRARDHLEGRGLLHPGDDLETGVVELVRARVRAGSGDVDGGSGGDSARVNAEAIVRHVLLTHHRADRLCLGERLRLADGLDAERFLVPPSDHTPAFTGRQEAAEWQDRALAAVPVLLDTALTSVGPVAVYVLAESTWPTCYGGGRTALGTQIFGFALRVARAHGHQRARLRLACYLARLWREAGEGERAVEALAEAQEAAGAWKGADDPSTAVLYETRALLLRSFPELVDDAQSSGDLIARARGLHRKHGRLRGEAMQTYQLGDDARRNGEPERAEEELAGARALAERRIGELERDGRSAPLGALEDWTLIRAKVRLAQAAVAIDRGAPDTADAEADGAAQVFCDYREPVRWVRAVRLRAEASELRGALDEARERLAEAGRVAQHYRLDEQVRGIRHHWGRLDLGEGSGEG